MSRLRSLVMIGAIGSIALMLYAGRSNAHVLITVGFIFWVLAPFALLALAEQRSARWAPATKGALQILTWLIVVGSLAIYAYRAAVPPHSTGAFVFVLVPPVSVALVLVGLAIGAMMSRPSRKGSP